MSDSPAAGLRLILEAPSRAWQGEPVRTRLILHNAQPVPVTVYLAGRPIAADLIVSRPDGTPVWRRLQDALIPAILQIRELQPGERLSFELAWDQMTATGERAAAGDYELQGALLTDAEPLMSDCVPVRVVPSAS